MFNIDKSKGGWCPRGLPVEIKVIHSFVGGGGICTFLKTAQQRSFKNT